MKLASLLPAAFTVATTLIAGCSSPPPPEHFEPGVFLPERPDVDDMMRTAFSNNLVAMNEPVIAPTTHDSVRFLYLRSFHHPIAVRVERRLAHVRLTAVELDGAGGYDPGVPTRRVTRNVSDEEWNDLLSLLDNASFWELPTSHERATLDGARWILEASVDGRYHVVQRNSPDETEMRGFRGACLWLLDTAAFTPVGDELY